MQLVVREGLEGVLVERLSARDAPRVMYRVGGRLPLHATTPGLVLLAFAPTQVQEDFLTADHPADDDSPSATADALRPKLAAIRRDRYAVFSRPQWDTLMTGVAAPILDRNHTTVAAISVITPSEQSQPAAHIPAVVAVARAITHAMTTDTAGGPISRMRSGLGWSRNCRGTRNCTVWSGVFGFQLEREIDAQRVRLVLAVQDSPRHVCQANSLFPQPLMGFPEGFRGSCTEEQLPGNGMHPGLSIRIVETLRNIQAEVGIEHHGIRPFQSVTGTSRQGLPL
ncbi:IclR family transcriptional regulator [Streptomyces nigrescens]